MQITEDLLLPKNIYCVYLHKDKDGVVRYVGSGSKFRAKSTRFRNKEWNSIFNLDNKPSIEYVFTDLTKEESLILEQEMIDKYIATICNKKSVEFVQELCFDKFNEFFIIDEESPSGLSWRSGFKHQARQGCAGSILRSRGKEYYRVLHNGKSTLVHRIIMLLHLGFIPDSLVVNHIDGNGLNNRLSNLQLVTTKYNNVFSKTSKNNTSGFRGIIWEDSVSRYAVTFTDSDGSIRKKSFSIGTFGSKEAALTAAIQFREALEDSIRKQEIILADKILSEYKETKQIKEIK